MFNIGVEGQLLVGWTAAVWVGASFDAPLTSTFRFRYWRGCGI